MTSPSPTPPATSLEAEVSSLSWYHTIELVHGICTPGEYDTRAAAGKVPLPLQLGGARCLDVGTHDGFWAFEMERRGAASVLAIDLDDPRQIEFSEPGPVWSADAIADRESRPLAFACAHRALSSRVVRRDLSVYALTKADLGEFDFAFLGTLLLHLRDPLEALAAIRRVLAPGGQLLVNDAISLGLSVRHPRRPVYTLPLLPGKPFWWMPNAQGLRRYVEKAGFNLLDSGRPYFVPRGPGYARPPIPRSAANFVSRAIHDRGMVHGWVLAAAP
jgi:tRNA (mo5U34)-methyltransferase